MEELASSLQGLGCPLLASWDLALASCLLQEPGQERQELLAWCLTKAGEDNLQSWLLDTGTCSSSETKAFLQGSMDRGLQLQVGVLITDYSW